MLYDMTNSDAVLRYAAAPPWYSTPSEVCFASVSTWEYKQSGCAGNDALMKPFAAALEAPQ